MPVKLADRRPGPTPHKDITMKFIIALILTLCGFAAHAADPGTYQLYPDLCINRVCVSNTNGAPVTTTPTQIHVDYFYGGGMTGISIEGVMYTGIGGGTVQAPDGRQAQLNLTWGTHRTCNVSGRGQHCTTFYDFQSGTLTVN